MANRSYPAANLPIITAITLRSVYLITPEPQAIQTFVLKLERCPRGGVRLVQLRAKALDEFRYRQLARRSAEPCKSYGAQLLLNAPPQLALELDAQGVHLTGERLMKLGERPLAKNKWVTVSCHNAAELHQAQRINADFVVVSPVLLPTQSHPRAACLGWEGLRHLADQANMPVYALGGTYPEYVT